MIHKSNSLCNRSLVPIDYLPILVWLVVVVGFATAGLIVSARVGPQRPTPAKLAPYESGMPPIGSARRRFFIKFYLTAVLFILFDIEIIFFYPWAVLFRQLGLFGLTEMGIFTLVLLIGYVYVLRKGGLDWD